MEMQDIIFVVLCIGLHCIGLMMMDPNARVGFKHAYNLIKYGGG